MCGVTRLDPGDDLFNANNESVRLLPARSSSSINPSFRQTEQVGSGQRPKQRTAALSVTVMAVKGTPAPAVLVVAIAPELSAVLPTA